jgi:hypothetical protein
MRSWNIDFIILDDPDGAVKLISGGKVDEMRTEFLLNLAPFDPFVRYKPNIWPQRVEANVEFPPDEALNEVVGAGVTWDETEAARVILPINTVGKGKGRQHCPAFCRPVKLAGFNYRLRFWPGLSCVGPLLRSTPVPNGGYREGGNQAQHPEQNFEPCLVHSRNYPLRSLEVQRLSKG